MKRVAAFDKICSYAVCSSCVCGVRVRAGVPPPHPHLPRSVLHTVTLGCVCPGAEHSTLGQTGRLTRSEEVMTGRLIKKNKKKQREDKREEEGKHDIYLGPTENEG